MSMPALKGVGDRLRKLREQMGFTQTDLGAKAGIAAASVSHFETGQRLPSLESLMKLADALGVSVDTLLGRAPTAPASEMDPIFLRASRADAQTLGVLRRVTAALLDEVDKK